VILSWFGVIVIVVAGVIRHRGSCVIVIVVSGAICRSTW